MKYTIKKDNKHYSKGYTIGTGHRRGLTWQLGGMVYIVIVFVVMAALAALAIFITPKLLLLAFLAIIGLSFTYAILADEHSGKFKVMPYREDQWDTAISVMYQPELNLVEELEKLLKYPELDNFVNRDELVEEVVTAIKLSESNKLDGGEIENYRSTLESLIVECERSRHKAMLAGKISHDSTVKAALDVAKSVNGDLQ